eukprot:g689.t1
MRETEKLPLEDAWEMELVLTTSLATQDNTTKQSRRRRHKMAEFAIGLIGRDGFFERFRVLRGQARQKRAPVYDMQRTTIGGALICRFRAGMKVLKYAAGSGSSGLSLATDRNRP